MYTSAILKIESYCKQHELDYEEWKEEVKKCNKAITKEFFLLLGALIGAGMLVLSSLRDIEQFIEQNKTEIIEEQENEEDISLEDIDVTQILTRKL